MSMFDQKRLIVSFFFFVSTKPRASFAVFASLLLQIKIGLDRATTPRSMVTDNSQLVLRADRMLFSRAGGLLVVCPDYSTRHRTANRLLY